MATTLPTLGMLEPDDGQGVPSVRQMLDVWSALPVEVLPVVEVPGISNLFRAFERTHDNGGARLHRFRIGPHPVFDWFASGHRLREIGFPQRFLLLPAVRGLFDCAFDEATVVSSIFEPVSGFSLDGELAQWLFSGGAYDQSQGDGSAEKAAALAFVKATFANRFRRLSSGGATRRGARGSAMSHGTRPGLSLTGACASCGCCA